MKRCKDCKWDRKEHPFVSVCPDRKRYQPGIADECNFYEHSWRKIMKNITQILIAWALIVLCILLMILIWGCTNHKITLPNGTVILRQTVFTENSARRYEFRYKDPNTAISIIVNDPNSRVNPGRLNITEPRTGIKFETETY